MSHHEDDLDLQGMKTGGKFRDIKRFRITDGTHLFRILPPYGENAQRRAARPLVTHWGFTTTDGKPRPVQCPRQFDDDCPVCEQYYNLLTDIDAETDKNNKKALQKKAGDLRPRKTFILNATNKDGEVGILELTKSAYDKLIKLFEEFVRKTSKMPTSLEHGVWFAFTREGSGFDTEYDVRINKEAYEDAAGDLVEKIDRAPLSKNVLENYHSSLGYDLFGMYKPTTADQMRRLLKGEKVDVVFPKKDRNETKAAGESEPEVAVEAAPAAAAPKAKPAAAKAAKAGDSELDELFG